MSEVVFSEPELMPDGETLRLQVRRGTEHAVAECAYLDWRKNPLKWERALKDAAYANLKAARRGRVAR